MTTMQRVAGGLLYIVIAGASSGLVSGVAETYDLSYEAKIGLAALAASLTAWYAAARWIDEASASSACIGLAGHLCMFAWYTYQALSGQEAAAPLLTTFAVGIAVFLGSEGRLEEDSNASTFLWGVFATVAQLAFALFIATARLEPMLMVMLAMLALLTASWFATRFGLPRPAEKL